MLAEINERKAVEAKRYEQSQLSKKRHKKFLLESGARCVTMICLTVNDFTSF